MIRTGCSPHTAFTGQVRLNDPQNKTPNRRYTSYPGSTCILPHCKANAGLTMFSVFTYLPVNFHRKSTVSILIIKHLSKKVNHIREYKHSFFTKALNFYHQTLNTKNHSCKGTCFCQSNNIFPYHSSQKPAFHPIYKY